MPVHSPLRFPGSPDGVIPAAYSWFVDPFVALARASAVTTRLKLGTGITLVPERNPSCSRRVAALILLFWRALPLRDRYWLAQGRNRILGGTFAHRWSQTREAINMKQLWMARRRVSRHLLRFSAGAFFLRPIQQPHPPIYIGGVATNVFKRTIEHGNGWMPTRATPELVQQGRHTLNELAVEAGRDPQSITIMAYLAPRDREKLQALQGAGADAAIMMLTKEPEHETLAELEQVAQAVL